jgi:hypothetical protein
VDSLRGIVDNRMSQCFQFQVQYTRSSWGSRLLLLQYLINRVEVAEVVEEAGENRAKVRQNVGCVPFRPPIYMAYLAQITNI